MSNESDERKDATKDLSRRKLLKGAGFAGVAAAATSLGTLAPDNKAAAAAAVGPARLEAPETLNASEFDALEAIVARLVPTDENGPGATEARAAFYIDRALAGPLTTLRPAYAAGLAALDAYAQSSKGRIFAKLATADQDDVLSDMEANRATGFTPNAAAFFNLLRAHTMQGMFCDPYYGGNANFVGWDLIGYPGLRMAVGAADQRMKKPAAVRKSAYDSGMFGRGAGGHDH